jgi:hypothetical protein
VNSAEINMGVQVPCSNLTHITLGFSSECINSLKTMAMFSTVSLLLGVANSTKVHTRISLTTCLSINRLQFFYVFRVLAYYSNLKEAVALK